MGTWLITGCSTGLGRALALAVLERQYNVVATARDVRQISDELVTAHDLALCLSLDVREPSQIKKAVAAAMERFGRIDVLVNNAGYGYRAAVEEGDDSQVRDLFETNFFGAVSLIKEILPAMRQRRRGFIVNVSSMAGRAAAAGSSYYSATKFALEGLSDALRKEVEPLGIRVMVVEPGSFRTDFAGRSLRQTKALISDYAATAGRRRKENDTSDGRQPGDPVRAARAIISAVEAAEPPFRLALGSDSLHYIFRELEKQSSELKAWAELSASTDFAS